MNEIKLEYLMTMRLPGYFSIIVSLQLHNNLSTNEIWNSMVESKIDTVSSITDFV